MKKPLILFSIALIYFKALCAQTPKPHTIKLQDLNFSFITATKKITDGSTYSLLGTSFMQPPASDNAKTMLSQWFGKHPNADVIPVCSFRPPDGVKDAAKQLFIFCWIIDNKDTLNNYLVKNGCFPGGTMYAYDEWKKMNASMQKGMPVPIIEVYVKKKDYETYQKQIVANEMYAHDHRIGLWSEKEYYKIKTIEEKNKSK